MKKVLSQDEIDSLINAMTTGDHVEEIEEEIKHIEAKNYDFRRPNKLSKDHIHSIENLYEGYCRISGNILSTHLRTNVELSVGSIEQVSYGEFIRSIPNPTLLTIFTMEPLRGPVIMEANASLGFQFINYLCGGIEEDQTEIRSFTEIEMALIRDMFKIIISSNKAAWSDLIELEPEFERVETNPQLNQSMSFSDSIVLLTLKISIGTYQNIMNLCIPYRALDPVIEKLHTIQYTHLNDGVSSEATFKNIIVDNIEDSPLNIDILLGKTSITVNDFLDMQEGDVLTLDNRVEDLLEMYVEDNLYYFVQPGLVSRRMSVQIVGDAGRKVT